MEKNRYIAKENVLFIALFLLYLLYSVDSRNKTEIAQLKEQVRILTELVNENNR